MTTSISQISEGCLVVGSLFNEPMRVETVRVGGDGSLAKAENCHAELPARLEWHEVTKVAHYYLSVNAMTRPMQVREDEAPYREDG